MIRKAGVSITVTSVTDLFAFFTGSLTLLPCVRSFSIVSAIGVLFLYFLSSTFLIACISIETSKEEEKKEERQCCCLSPAPGSTDNCTASGSTDICTASGSTDNCTASGSTQDSTEDSTESCSFSLDMRSEVGYLLTESIIFKLAVICLAGGVLGVSVWGSTMLRDDFDPGVFIPKDSYLGLFYEAEREYFPEVGDTVVLYFANVNHTQEFVRIRNLLLTLEKEKHIAFLDNWTEDFMSYLNHYVFKKSGTTFIDTESYDKLLKNGTFFQEKLIQFLYSIKGSPRRSVFKNFDTMDVSCGGSDTVLFSNLRYRHVQLGDSEERMKAMMAVKDLINASNIQGHVFTMSRDYANLETEQVVKAEIFSVPLCSHHLPVPAGRPHHLVPSRLHCHTHPCQYHGIYAFSGTNSNRVYLFNAHTLMWTLNRFCCSCCSWIHNLLS
ncbi:patched domain-containing protein 3 isoform X2 [Eurytemora carolleeae]|uniref:patched domain-containing protein 3 isoform X2 n=1 Tax=Eurytemora carolleeae TaxID=1294199 RepID=UPI000C763E11|nr:patched domain-containing protein 3 isoform X2 [Eurytemora carolleeae]|eukprot:XP_023326426.1 patched domain-containing protein 3-like isoform X2 [Eurytemora affinis]